MRRASEPSRRASETILSGPSQRSTSAPKSGQIGQRLSRIPSLNQQVDPVPQEQQAKINEVVEIIDKVGSTLDSAEKVLETYEKNKKALSELTISNVPLNFNAMPNSHVKKLNIKEKLEEEKTDIQTKISTLFEEYHSFLREAKTKIAEARTRYPEMQDLNTRLHFYTDPIGKYGNTIIKLESVYKTIKQDDRELEKNPWLNDAITYILEYNEDSYKDKINKMIDESKDYTSNNKIYVYGTLVYYLMVRIKSKKEEVLPKKPDVFINEEIFMNRKDDLNKLFLELQNSESDMELYDSLAKVFELLTLPKDKYSTHFVNITSEEVKQLNANQGKESLELPIVRPSVMQNRRASLPRPSIYDPNEENKRLNRI
jgi:hypothetical protein